MCGDTAARAADPTLLILALEIFSAGENPIFAMWQPREEVAEPEGQAGPGGTSLFQEHIPVPTGDTHPCSHPSWQGSEVCSWGSSQAVPPRAGTQIFTPGIDPIKLLLLPDPHSSFLMRVFQPNAEAFAIP